MFPLAVILVSFSYSILILGLLRLWQIGPMWGVTVIFLLFLVDWFLLALKRIKWQGKIERFSLFLIILLTLQAGVNLIGALGPEMGFDALWYHLTIPKIYLENQGFIHVPGSLLYYSEMPKFTEMFYLVALALGNEIWAKIIHWLFGILCVVALYQLIRRYFSSKIALLGSVIFYSMLIVGWQSITAYVDLARTFFEILTLNYFLDWWEKGRQKDLFKAAFTLGIALSTKLLVLGSLLIFTILIISYALAHKVKKGNLVIWLLGYLVISLLVASPWYFLSYFHTGNPFYPMFTGWLERHQMVEALAFPTWWVNHNLWSYFTSFWQFTFHPDDKLTPIFLAFLPLTFVVLWRLKSLRIVAVYFFLALTSWYFTPPPANRYLLPYLPALTLLTVSVFQVKWPAPPFIKKILYALVIIVVLVNIASRAYANAKYLPVIFGRETKQDFLTKNLPFETSVFYDTDGYFAKNIKPADLVLISGTHNLFYVNFPFVHELWMTGKEKFTYVLIQNGNLPAKFSQAPLVYNNPKTGVKLYKIE